MSEHFKEVLSRYQGKQTGLDKIFYIKLDHYFGKKGWPSSKEYKAMPLLTDGTKLNTNRDMIFRALNELGYSQYRCYIDIICSDFFGWCLPEIEIFLKMEPLDVGI
jgi:hypothetical protein